MTGSSNPDPLRELLHHMTARYLAVRPEGIVIEGRTGFLPRLDVQILAYGGARTLYRGRGPMCRSLDGIKSVQDSRKLCSECLDRKHCTPQVRVDLLHENLPYRLLLAYSSAKNFLLYAPRFTSLDALAHVRTRIRVVHRGSWGELQFESLDGPGRSALAPRT